MIVIVASAQGNAAGGGDVIPDAIDFGNVVKRGLELLRNDAVLHGLPSDGSPVVTITDIGT